MNPKIKDHLIKVAEAKKWPTDDKSLVQILRESKLIYKENFGSRPWYDDMFKVLEVNGIKIGFNDFYLTEDNNADDMGLYIDMDEITEVVEKVKTATYYEPVD